MLRWSLSDGTAEVTITSDVAQTIKVSCGLSNETKTVTFKDGESITVAFNISR